MKKIKIFDPTAKAKEEKIVYVPRPKSLQHARIGLVDNTKYNSDKLLLRIAALLEQEYGAQSHLILKKRKAGVPVHDEMIQEYKRQCDVVIAGIGD